MNWNWTYYNFSGTTVCKNFMPDWKDTDFDQCETYSQSAARNFETSAALGACSLALLFLDFVDNTKAGHEVELNPL